MKLFILGERITIEVLKILKYEHVKELIQNLKMGDRAIFEYHFENWRNELEIPLNISGIFRNIRSYSPDSSIKRSSCRSSPRPYPIRDNFSPEPADNKYITLAEILRENRKASIIAEFYDSNNKLDDEHRNLLISSIANHFESNNTHKSLQTSYRLEKEILEMFPNEKLDFYRTEKRGKIYAKFCNLKQSLKTFVKKSKKIVMTQGKISTKP